MNYATHFRMIEDWAALRKPKKPLTPTQRLKVMLNYRVAQEDVYNPIPALKISFPMKDFDGPVKWQYKYARCEELHDFFAKLVYHIEQVSLCVFDILYKNDISQLKWFYQASSLSGELNRRLFLISLDRALYMYGITFDPRIDRRFLSSRYQ
jgi:hypothetical protein